MTSSSGTGPRRRLRRPAPSAATIRHRERLTPSPLTWTLPLIAAAICAVMVLPVGPVVSVVVAVAVLAATCGCLWRLGAVVQVTDDWLIAGTARVERRFITAAAPIEPADLPAAMGTELDSRAHVLTRPWVHSAVRVSLDDPDDPTPYWLVASREPARLARALR